LLCYAKDCSLPGVIETWIWWPNTKEDNLYSLSKPMRPLQAVEGKRDHFLFSEQCLVEPRSRLFAPKLRPLFHLLSPAFLFVLNIQRRGTTAL
jgi:hypothetical protein